MFTCPQVDEIVENGRVGSDEELDSEDEEDSSDEYDSDDSDDDWNRRRKRRLK